MPKFARWSIGSCVATMLILFGSCRSPTQPGQSPIGEDAGRPVIYTVNYPLAYFAERIGGDHVRVVFPVPPGVDPAFWRPEGEVIRGYQTADLILLNGASFAQWAEHMALPRRRMVITARAFADRYIEIQDRVVHQHGPHGEHAHEGFAVTTWLDPQLALQQAEAIRDELTERWPEHSSAFHAGWETLHDDWMELDERLTAIHTAYQDQPLLASHPVYQYLERRYRWNLVSMHWEPDEMPEAGDWEDLQEILEDHPAGWMIWEAEPLPEIRQRLSEMGIDSVVFEPCSNVPESGDLLSTMHANVKQLQRIMVGEPASSAP